VSNDGVAVFAAAGFDGYAFRSESRMQVWSSGVATIPATKTTVTLNPLTMVSSLSFVLLTPMANLGGRSLWFTLDSVTNRLTIRMSSKRTSPTKVAWLMFDRVS
jgi:hypothetical protein